MGLVVYDVVWGLTPWKEAVYVVSYGPPVGLKYAGGPNEEEDKYRAVSTNACVILICFQMFYLG